MSDLFSANAVPAIQQGLERQRFDDWQVVRMRLVVQQTVPEDPPGHQPMAVLELEPSPTGDERRLDVSLGALAT